MLLVAILCSLLYALPAMAAEAPADLLFVAHFDATADADWAKGDRMARPLAPTTKDGGGKLGEALSLEGKGAIAFAAPGNLNADAGAVEMWISPRWQGGDGIVRTLFDAAWGERQWIRINKIAANRLGIATIAGSNESYRRLDQDISAWKPGEWHHVAAAWGGGRLRFWIDGAEVERGHTDMPPFTGAPETFTLGPCDALLDEVRIWGAYREVFDRDVAAAHPEMPPVPRRPPGLPPAGDLDRFTFSLQEIAEGVLIARKDYLDDIDPGRAPAAEEAGAALDTFSPRGEVEPVAFVLYAGRDLKEVRVSSSDLKGPTGSIRADHVEIRLAVRSLMRRLYTRPPEESDPVSRFLRRNQAFDLPKGHFREVVATIRVPADAAPGTYQGALSVQASGARAGELPVRLEVLPFRLPETPRKRYGCYYHFPTLPEERKRAELELRDIRAHGGTILVPHLGIQYRREGENIIPDYTGIRQGLELMRSAGLSGPIPISTGLNSLIRLLDLPKEWLEAGPEAAGQQRLNEAARPALEGLKGVAKEFPEFKLLATHMDEVFNRGRLPLYIALTRAVRQVSDLPVYITLHNRAAPEIEQMAREIDPFVDVRCYNGHVMDDWVKAGNRWEDLAQELRKSGDEAWIYYNPRGSFVTPEWFRIINGLYMWWGPFTGHVVWTYHYINGDAFDDTDDRRPEMGFAFPSDEDGITPVPTRHWEAFREGAEDARALCYLEELAEEARRKEPKAAAQAAAWLAEVRALMPGQDQLQGIDEESPVLVAVSKRFSGADYQRLRRRTMEEIVTLLRISGR